MKKKTDINSERSETLFRYFIKSLKERKDWNKTIKYVNKAKKTADKAMKYVNEIKKLTNKTMTIRSDQTETKTKWLYTVSKISNSEWRDTNKDATETIKWWQKKTKWFVLKSNIKN